MLKQLSTESHEIFQKEFEIKCTISWKCLLFVGKWRVKIESKNWWKILKDARVRVLQITRNLRQGKYYSKERHVYIRKICMVVGASESYKRVDSEFYPTVVVRLSK